MRIIKGSHINLGCVGLTNSLFDVRARVVLWWRSEDYTHLIDFKPHLYTNKIFIIFILYIPTYNQGK